MKNSPHRHKHQVNKAVREAKRTHPLPQKSSPEAPSAKRAQEHASLKRPNERLTPADPKVSKEMVEVFKKHVEKMRHVANPKHSKRANPGMIEGESPYTHIRHHKDTKLQKKNQPSLEKSHDIARKVIKNQNYRKAA